jgi:hypothetical protein
LSFAEQSLALARSKGDAIDEARALGRYGSLLSEVGRQDEAENALQASADLCGRIGMVQMQRNAMFNLCVLHSARSRPDEVLRVARLAWNAAPTFEREPLRVQLALVFVEALSALGDLGQAWHWALRAVDDVMTLEQIVGYIGVAQTVAEVLSVLGEEDHLAPMFDRLSPQTRRELAGVTIEIWLIHTECALLEGDLDKARRFWAELPSAPPENPRELARLAMTTAAFVLAQGDAASALASLPADDSPGMNEELRWRTLTVRLQAEAALGGCQAATMHAAEQALQHDGVHALAALVLHRALVQGAPTPALREAWRVRVDALAATLAGEPALQARFVQRWRHTAG